MAQSTASPLIEIVDLTKVYKMGEMEVHALRGVSLSIQPGEYVAIVGTSGSGKSTLMNMIGLLDQPTDGVYRVRGTESQKLGKKALADMRNREIGFVFQRFNLLARAPAMRQVELPLFYAGVGARKSKQMATEALTLVGLGERTHHRPEELSGGQQQRVAIARAIVNQPSLLLADEPTGALDTQTGEEILTLFEELHSQGLTLIVVTHDPDVAARAHRVITMRDGLIVEDRVQVPSKAALSHSVPVPAGTAPAATAPAATAPRPVNQPAAEPRIILETLDGAAA
jgi:putative ABC transport system ATP-binding protein